MIRGIILTAAAATIFVTGTSAARSAGEPSRSTANPTVVVTGRTAIPASPNVFGTVALDAGVTSYGARWRRVSAADRGDPRVLAIAAAATRAAGPDPVARLAAVHGEVGRRIRWRRDLDTYHISDYWAQAGETLSRGEGDSEDIAILKMQILKASGFAARDIYLSVGRDATRGADTRLIVRIGSDFYTLDDRSPTLLLGLAAQRFTPVITLGQNTAWLHGRRVAARRLTGRRLGSD